MAWEGFELDMGRDFLYIDQPHTQSLEGCLEGGIADLPLSKHSSALCCQLEESCFCRFGMTSWVLALNEMSPGLQQLLPPTDTRMRADIRALEQGRYDQVRWACCALLHPATFPPLSRRPDECSRVPS